MKFVADKEEIQKKIIESVDDLGKEVVEDFGEERIIKKEDISKELLNLWILDSSITLRKKNFLRFF